MSPASTDGLHVERYIGSYLISNSARAPDHRKYHHSAHGRHYVGSPGVYRPGYGLFQPPAYCHGQSSWAGVPLISTANGRRNRKPHGAPLQPPPPRQPLPASRALDYAEGQLPLSRLALHARGAPLILSRRYNNNNNNNNANNNNINGGRKPTHCLADYRQTTAPTTPRPVAPDFVPKKTGEVLPKDAGFECKDRGGNEVGRSPPGDAGRAANVDSLSVTSDESSGSANSETCLPRIIKPRKRRKKDRKPPSGPTQEKPQTPDDGKSESASSYESEGGPAAPFVPGFFGGPETTEGDAPDFDLRADGEGPAPAGPAGPAEARRRPEDAGDDSDDSSSLFEAISRCSPTVCQCRYCEPSEQTWDFDRFCYSSLFSSPSECDVASTASDSSRGKSSLDSNPFADKESALRRSWSEPCPGYSVENLRISDFDGQPPSRRSEPGARDRDAVGEPAVAGSAFGPVGAGRRRAGSRDSRDSSRSSDWKAAAVPQSPEHVPEILFKCFPPSGPVEVDSLPARPEEVRPVAVQ